MRTVLPFAAALVLLASPLAASAQDLSPGPRDPSVIDPEGAPGVMPELPLPPGDGEEEPPMVMPAPDADPEAPPEAFGGPMDETFDGDQDGGETASPLASPETDTSAEAAAPQSEAETRDALFAELKQATSKSEARRIARRIEQSWRRSGSATVDLLMRRAARAIGHKEMPVALDVLDQALVLAPDYAEAWNRRATAHYQNEDYGKSLADIEQVLAREPRHWGAMMGLAIILERTGHRKEALESYMQVLSIYPTLKSAQDAVGRLAEKLTGPRI